MTFRIIMMVVMMSIAMFSCNKDSLKGCDEHAVAKCNEAINKTNIRIVNGSKYDFCNVVLNPSEGNVNYGIIEAGNATCYRTYNTAYNSASANLKIGDKTFSLIPEDYQGQTPLGNGKFTYTIDVLNFNSGSLSIDVSKN